MATLLRTDETDRFTGAECRGVGPGDQGSGGTLRRPKRDGFASLYLDRFAR